MKKLFLIAALCGCYAAKAQLPNKIITQADIQKLFKEKGKVRYYSLTQPGINIDPKIYVTPPRPVIPQAPLVQVLPNGNKVYALPQDNMPCVVPAPAPQQFNIPNATTSLSFIKLYP